MVLPDAIVGSWTQFRELVGLIGWQSSLALVEMFGQGGNYRLYIPKKVEGHRLVDVVGFEALELLAWHYGGLRISLPSWGQLQALQQRQARDREIALAREASSALAVRWGLRDRQVRHIRQAWRSHRLKDQGVRVDNGAVESR